MSGIWKSRWQSVALALVVAAGLGLLVLSLPGRAKASVGAASEFLALGSVLTGYIRGAWRRAAAVPTADQVSQARRALAGLVAVQWRGEAAVRQLNEPDPMAVRWRMSRPGAARRPAPAGIPLESGIGDGTADVAELARLFRGLPRRRLLVLGGAGTGKTTLAVSLLLHLLAQRDDSAPVPVLFTLTGWDPRSEDFPSWLARRLAEDYPALRDPEAFGPGAAAALVGHGQILPLLDGLDEVPGAVRAAVITALNRAMSGDDQLIITARVAEYAAADTAVLAAAVIEPGPLAPADIVDYITACLSREPDEAWRNVLRAIRQDARSPLAQILATPLTLWLFRQVYVGTQMDPSPLTDPACFRTTEAITSHLLGNLIKALIDANPPARRGQADPRPFQPLRSWNPADAQRWLGYLARNPGTGDLAWWQLPATVPRWQVKLMSALITGLVFGPPLGIAIGIAVRAWIGRSAGGVPAWLVSGMLPGTALGFLAGPRPVPRRAASRRLRLAHRIRRGLSAGTLVGIATGTAAQLVSPMPGTGILFGLAAAVAAGLGAGLARGTTATPSYANLSLRGRMRPLLRSVLRGILFGLVFGLAFGLSAELVAVTLAGYQRGSGAWIVFFTVFGLPAGLAFGLAFGLIGWADASAGSARPGTPATVLRDERRFLVFRGLVFGLPTFIFTGLALTAGLQVPEPADLVIGLTFGMVCGLMAAATAGLSGTWPAYVAARMLLAARGLLPVRLMGFLDDAYRLGILRQAGAVYQFRHAALREHLATVIRT